MRIAAEKKRKQDEERRRKHEEDAGQNRISYVQLAGCLSEP